MPRCIRWDYSRPVYYLVTMKRRPHLPPLAVLSATHLWGYDPDYPITRAFAQTLRDFAAQSPGIESLSPYRIMPDRLHLLIKIAPVPEREPLGIYVRILKHLLQTTFRRVTGIKETLFEPGYRDCIVKSRAQLPTFSHYIRANPIIARLRETHRDPFHCYRAYRHWRLGWRAVDLVGNPELLEEPLLFSVKLAQHITPESPEWRALEIRLEALQSAVTAIGTWRTQQEKAALRLLLERGSYAIVLSPYGFPEAWHPAGEMSKKWCIEGRLLYLSPYPPKNCAPPPELIQNRHLELDDLAQQITTARYPTHS